MPPSRDVRRDQFAAFVRRALDNAKIRGWSMVRVATEAKLSRNALYGWLNGTWVEEPKAQNVTNFCDALGLDAEEAYAILYPSGQRPARRDATPSAPLDPRVVALLRVLNDPNTSDDTKDFIYLTLAYLTQLPQLRPPSRRRKAS